MLHSQSGPDRARQRFFGRTSAWGCFQTLRHVLRIAGGLGLIYGPSAAAVVTPMPDTLTKEVLSETVPTAGLFPPGHLEAPDFRVEWVGVPLDGVRFKLGEDSLQWVRVADVMVLPRGRILLEADGIDAGQVSNAGFTQSFARAPGQSAVAEMPIALISGNLNAVDVRLVRGGKVLTGHLALRFAPRDPQKLGQRIFTDTSCSPYFTEVLRQETTPPTDWLYLGCRFSYSSGDQHATGSLEVWAFWDGVSQVIKIDGVATDAGAVSLWALRLRAQPGQVDLESPYHHRVRLRYRIPETLHRASLGLGIGPYSYFFQAPDTVSRTVAPVLTVYGSYFLMESTRFVMFDATAFNHNFFSDVGVYISNESLKVFDRRLTFSVMLGGHAIAFPSGGATHFVIGAPQGAELMFRDFLEAGKNLSFGSFVYPPIDDKAYYNVWLRWGSPAFFGEFNYIGWGEKIAEQKITSRSLGVSVGFPIARLW